MFLLLILFLVWLAYKWSIDGQDYFEKLKLPFEKPLPLVGNMMDIVLHRQSLIDITRRSYDKYKSSKYEIPEFFKY